MSKIVAIFPMYTYCTIFWADVQLLQQLGGHWLSLVGKERLIGCLINNPVRSDLEGTLNKRQLVLKILQKQNDWFFS